MGDLTPPDEPRPRVVGGPVGAEERQAGEREAAEHEQPPRAGAGGAARCAVGRAAARARERRRRRRWSSSAPRPQATRAPAHAYTAARSRPGASARRDTASGSRAACRAPPRGTRCQYPRGCDARVPRARTRPRASPSGSRDRRPQRGGVSPSGAATRSRPRPADWRPRTLVVDDGSTDRTSEVARAARRAGRPAGAQLRPRRRAAGRLPAGPRARRQLHRDARRRWPVGPGRVAPVLEPRGRDEADSSSARGFSGGRRPRTDFARPECMCSPRSCGC